MTSSHVLILDFYYFACLAESVSKDELSCFAKRQADFSPPLLTTPALAKNLVDYNFLYAAIAVPHDVESLNGNRQSLTVQRVARCFLCLAMIVNLVNA